MSKLTKSELGNSKNFVILKRNEGAINFKGWTTVNGMIKSTNHLEISYSITVCIKGQHISTNVSIQHEGAITHLNLKRSIRDQIILSQRADGCMAKKVKT
ncbi:20327_t:CDS:1 [Gigaspora margarita]|uniref:20327_t:CDS:1 n=1 Tax=Gigaspora margarita TaxID=4874 RepID=A0ABN7V5L8_GIGMA|nr:20327_t:CDS:1 [Gigaspora margarita]